MPLVNRTISNLFGGVSQQPAGIRLDNQCEEMINAYPSITDGLVKRPPTELISNLSEPAPTGTISMVVVSDDVNRILDSASQFIVRLPRLAAGHMLRIAGFSHPENNGEFEVLEVLAGRIKINAAGAVDEAAGNVIKLLDLAVS